ncbi:tetratricopeptide repeat protein [Olleya sp. YS]|uniref:tetratricopeptide repeat protein n=1 Tax=Olleya sp. YS TaxID=3028318 RepID=UPI0024346314|nr:tetratricopeptide repeat protein [Olleya sp. YS]WGD33523.1 tetratricopeptide repeat protein [Olleya sp. YS]
MQEQDYILFENYLSGDLSSEEIADFENRVSTDEDFKQAFTIYKELSEHLQHEIGNEDNTTDFRANLDSISHRYFTKLDIEENPVEVKKTFSFYKLAVAASIALIMGFFVFNQFSGGADYYDFNDHGTIDFTERSSEDNVGLLIKTTKAFNNKEYKEAKSYLEELLKDNPENVEYNFYYAITNIELDNFDQADSILGTIANGNSAYKNKATWYWALSKLKQDKKEDCIKLLKQIPEDADDYSQALKLLKKLK